KIRYGDRLRVVVDVDDRARNALVPVLVLQPVLENALHHGVGPCAAGGCVGITVRVDGDEMVMTVWDDGVGLESDSIAGNGVGLTNTRERLRHAFGARQLIGMSPRDGGGVEVVMRTPLLRQGMDNR
ncbi:MAG: ATP-binding protein, partial [Gemmatimonadaceae bacterium]